MLERAVAGEGGGPRGKEPGFGGYPVPAALRALRCLVLLADRPNGLTAAEVGRLLGIAPASAHNLMRTLRAEGFADRDEETKRYTLGPVALTISEKAAPVVRRKLHVHAGGHVHNLVTKTKLGAHVAILLHGDAVYIARAEPPNFVRNGVWADIYIGRHMTPQITAIGRALMCHLPQDVVKEIFEQHPIPPDSPVKTLTLRALLSKLEETRARGYAIDDQETALGVRCVAAPVYTVGQRVVAAIGVSGTVGELGLSDVKAVAAHVRDEARELSMRLGGGGLLPRAA